MTHVEMRCGDCGGDVVFVDAPDLVGIEGPGPMPESVSAKRWICPRCETSLGFFVDYGTVDLGIVRDSVLNDRSDWGGMIYTDADGVPFDPQPVREPLPEVRLAPEEDA